MASGGGPSPAATPTFFSLLLSPALLLHNMESCKSSLPQLRANQRDEHHNKCEMAKISAISIPNIAGARVASLSCSCSRSQTEISKPSRSNLCFLSRSLFLILFSHSCLPPAAL